MSGIQITRSVTLLAFIFAVLGLLTYSAGFYEERQYPQAACWLLFTVVVALVGIILDRLLEAHQ